MKFTIDWCETLISSKGNPYKKCSVTDESGRKLENVAVFSFFNGYAAVMPGATVEGALESKLFNGKESFSIVNMNGPANQSPGGAFKAFGGVAKAQQVKAENIEKAQENKELGIKISSTIRMAVDLAIAEHNPVGDDLVAAIKMWRQWLWLEWDKEDKDYPPFN